MQGSVLCSRILGSRFLGDLTLKGETEEMAPKKLIYPVTEMLAEYVVRASDCSPISILPVID